MISKVYSVTPKLRYIFSSIKSVMFHYNGKVSPRTLSSSVGLPVITSLHVWQRSISGFPSPPSQWASASSSALAWQVSQIIWPCPHCFNLIGGLATSMHTGHSTSNDGLGCYCSVLDLLDTARVRSWIIFFNSLVCVALLASIFLIVAWRLSLLASIFSIVSWRLSTVCSSSSTLSIVFSLVKSLCGKTSSSSSSSSTWRVRLPLHLERRSSLVHLS